MTRLERLVILGVGSFSAERAAMASPADAVTMAPSAVPATAAHSPDASLLSARMRGRASVLIRIFADVVGQAATRAGVDLLRVPMIFGSAFGEMGTTQRLLESSQGGDGRLSPTQFQSSVFNAAAGQLSISLGNAEFTTSLAAGRDTFAMCMLEAWGWLSTNGGQVLVACADEPVDALFQPSTDQDAFGVALVLGLPGEQTPLAYVSRPRSRRSPTVNARNAATASGNELYASARAMLDALSGVEATRVCLSPREEWGWYVDVQPLAAPEAAPRQTDAMVGVICPEDDALKVPEDRRQGC